MNKFGFLTLILTFVLFFLQFIPLGVYFQLQYPFVNCHVRIPIQLFTYQNNQLFIWGIKTGGVFVHWFALNILTGIFFIVLLPLAGIITMFGFCKENRTGKKLILANFVILLAILLYALIGIPIYSLQIFGVQFGYFEIFLYLNYGFFILLIDLICATIGYIKHPIL